MPASGPEPIQIALELGGALRPLAGSPVIPELERDIAAQLSDLMLELGIEGRVGVATFPADDERALRVRVEGWEIPYPSSLLWRVWLALAGRLDAPLPASTDADDGYDGWLQAWVSEGHGEPAPGLTFDVMAFLAELSTAVVARAPRLPARRRHGYRGGAGIAAPPPPRPGDQHSRPLVHRGHRGLGPRPRSFRGGRRGGCAGRATASAHRAGVSDRGAGRRTAAVPRVVLCRLRNLGAGGGADHDERGDRDGRARESPATDSRARAPDGQGPSPRGPGRPGSTRHRLFACGESAPWHPGEHREHGGGGECPGAGLRPDRDRGNRPLSRARRGPRCPSLPPARGTRAGLRPDRPRRPGTGDARARLDLHPDAHPPRARSRRDLDPEPARDSRPHRALPSDPGERAGHTRPERRPPTDRG